MRRSLSSLCAQPFDDKKHTISLQTTIIHSPTSILKLKQRFLERKFTAAAAAAAVAAAAATAACASQRMTFPRAQRWIRVSRL